MAIIRFDHICVINPIRNGDGRMEWLVLIMYVVLAVMPAEASTNGSVSLLHGDGYETGDNTRNIARFDVLHVNKGVMFYGRVDNSSFDDSNSINNTRLVGHCDTSLGFHIAGQYQNGYKQSASSVGVGYKSITKEKMFLIDTYLQSSNIFGEGLQLFAYAKSPRYNGFYLEGFVDNTYYDKVTITLAQPSLMYEVKDGVSVGVEYQLYWNKLGVSGLNESVPQAKLKWSF